MHWNRHWPILRHYEGACLRKVAMPLGGIGTGTISLGGRGDLRDWEYMNKPGKGFHPAGYRGSGGFFALFAKAGRGPAVARCLEGPIPPEDADGDNGCRVANHGLPHFERASFAAAYPLAQVSLHDPAVPLRVRIEAFNPLTPPDAEDSGLPVAAVRYVLTNPGRQPVTAAVCGTLINHIGFDGTNTSRGGFDDIRDRRVMRDNCNTHHRTRGLHAVVARSRRPDIYCEQYGTIALAAMPPAGADVTHRVAWDQSVGWNQSLLDFWEDFADDGRLEPRKHGQEAAPRMSLAVRLNIPPRGERAVSFLIAWHFPNRQSWTPPAKCDGDTCDSCDDTQPGPAWVGNHYATRHDDALNVVRDVARRLPDLEARTVAFVRGFCESDLPETVKEAALFNLSTLRSHTCFRTADGRFYGWEGCFDRGGCCHGSCTHVWNYESGLGHLFGSLSRSMREVEFLHTLDDRGAMSFRVNLPLDKAKSFAHAAADGQMGSLMRLYRDWRLCGDDDWLGRLWPSAKRAMAFCWIPGGWDADRDGVMEGCQHNTMDIEYYGPNPQMGFWYLGALRACAEMARTAGDPAFADTCDTLARRGRAWIERHLFNGDFYEHHIPAQPPPTPPAEGLQLGSKRHDPTRFQLGKGCLVDQLVGQVVAQQVGLGHLADPRQIRTTLESIHRWNRRQPIKDHVNPMRTYALSDEGGLVMASYPRGQRPKHPFPYFNEFMTGFEYTAAVGMLQEGLTRQGLDAIAAIRRRHDGLRRNPFDEAECGHHYARALMAWAAVDALSGFDYHAAEHRLAVRRARKPTTWFWASGDACGTITQTPARRGLKLTVHVIAGAITLQTLVIGSTSYTLGAKPRRVDTKRPLVTNLPASKNRPRPRRS